MKFDINNINKYIAGSDTDSLFITLEPIIKKQHPDLNLNDTNEVLQKIRPLQKEIGDKLNSYQSYLAKNLLNSEEHFFDLKPEFIIKRAYWAGKRRYAQYIVDQEGMLIDAFDIKGLDIMKSNFPPLFRDFGESLIKKILFDVPKPEIDKFILDWKKSLDSIDWKKLLKPTGLKKLDEYISKKPDAGEIFSKLALKCPVNTKAAIYTNDLLKFKKLNKKYQHFQIGDKMYIAYLKENPYRIDVLGINGYDDAPEILEFVEKYIDRNQMFESVIKNKIENLYTDLNWGMPIFNEKVNKFFKF